jgi:hypothetical protein
MKQPIPIYLAVEDELSEWVARRALAVHSRRFAVGPVFGRRGFGYLKRQTGAFNNAAKGCPFLLLTDLDRYACPPELIGEWLRTPRHRHFLLRVAVREVESWLLGDASRLGKFLKLRSPLSVPDPESLEEPKQALLGAAMKCPSRLMREALVWRDGQSGQLFQGPDYNGTLARFVNGQWDVATARRKCRSLEGLLAALSRLEAEYGQQG